MQMIDAADQLAIGLVLPPAFFFGNRIIRDIPGFSIVTVGQRIFDGDRRGFRAADQVCIRSLYSVMRVKALRWAGVG